MGGKNRSVSNPQSEELARIASDWYSSTDPIRQALIGDAMNFLGVEAQPQQPVIQPVAQPEPTDGVFLSGGDNAPNVVNTPPPQIQPAEETVIRRGGPEPAPGPTGVESSPLFAAIKQATEDQYSRARDNILASTPAGGALSANLASLESAKAGDLTQQIGNLYREELNRAYSLATGQPFQSSLQGLGTAGAIQSNLAVAQQQQNSQVKSSIGQGVGSYFGGAMGGAAGQQMGSKS